MTTPLEKLQTLLRELFQLDQADLDFGIYRIMNHNREEIVRFLQEDLLPQVQAGFSDYEQADRERLQEQLEDTIQQAQTLLELSREEAENTPRVVRIKEQLQEQVDQQALEQEVYAHLYNFFRRYYHEGDFLSLRRYKEGVYAIPYEGEEVKLHWANADQYYIKTAEHFQNYGFKLPSGRRVRFEIVSASTEQNNNKPTNGKERRFMLHEADPAGLEGTDLVLRFEYQPDPQKRKQEELNQLAHAGIMALPDLAEWQRELAIAAPTASNADRTLLQKHLADFTARNTFDYFIHKDLGGFLRRELDFYIKSEVMNLEDIQHDSPMRVKHLISKVRVLREIGDKIIQFLAQIEEFQKKIWLKKKFVLETHYCITLDRVPEALYADIIASTAQLEEWKRLFAIDEIEEKVGDLFGGGNPGYSEPLTIEFLKANNKLLIDTRFFDEGFKAYLVTSIKDFDSQCDGLVIHAENFQALNLLSERYYQSVGLIYIDPPYNTGGDGFFYKDNYEHSSWLSMIFDRLQISHKFLHKDGIIYVSIDAKERNFLETALNQVFGIENRVEEVIWAQNTTKNQSPTFSTNHEYVPVYAKDITSVKKEPTMFREIKPGYIEIVDLIERINPQYPAIQVVESSLKELFLKHKQDMFDQFGDDFIEMDPWKGIYNYNRAEYRDVNGKYVNEHEARDKNASIWIWREDNPSMPQVKEDSQKAAFRDPDDPTYRFYKPLHPITGKPCQAPKRGWSWPFKPHGNQRFSFSELAEDYRIAWGENENKIPQTKRFLHEVETNVSKSVINDYSDGEKELTNIFGKTRVFSGPKPTTLISKFCSQASFSSNLVLDFFAGSGTTGHAVIDLNRRDLKQRKYVLVEVGDYFDNVLKPRLVKVIYCDEWRDGKARNFNTGISHCIKYMRLESYEDALNNIQKNQRTRQQELALEQNPRFREEYMLTYKLDTEARGSASLLNPVAFIHPFNYQLKVVQNDDTRYVAVDLIETFNYLLGLTVQRLDLVNAIKTVRGVNRWGDRVLVIWRDLEETDNNTLDDWFKAQGHDQPDSGFDIVYVNGDNTLENLRPTTETWRVLLTDSEFHRLMFDIQEV